MHNSAIMNIHKRTLHTVLSSRIQSRYKVIRAWEKLLLVLSLLETDIRNITNTVSYIAF